MLNKKEFWVTVIGESWYNLNPSFWDSDKTAQILNSIMSLYSDSSLTVYPKQKDIFRAFRETSLNNLKVVILGQDPYFDGSATGLAFANEGLRVSPSLKKIAQCVEKELYGGLNVMFDHTLSHWTKQGVLLLNTSLTVEKYKPGSHYNIWHEFISTLLMLISINKNDLFFCLWGKKAQEYQKVINCESHRVMTFQHPAYAARNNKDWECYHFKHINQEIGIQW